MCVVLPMICDMLSTGLHVFRRCYQGYKFVESSLESLDVLLDLEEIKSLRLLREASPKGQLAPMQQLAWLRIEPYRMSPWTFLRSIDEDILNGLLLITMLCPKRGIEGARLREAQIQSPSQAAYLYHGRVHPPAIPIN